MHLVVMLNKQGVHVNAFIISHCITGPQQSKLVLQQENSSATRIKLNFHSSFKILGSHRKLFLNLIEGADNSNANKPRISQTPDNKSLHSLPKQAMLSLST